MVRAALPRFVSRVYCLAVIIMWGLLVYYEFKVKATVSMVISLFVGAFIVKANIWPIFDWGDGTRKWDGSCKYALSTGIVWGIITLSVIIFWLAKS